MLGRFVLQDLVGANFIVGLNIILDFSDKMCYTKSKIELSLPQVAGSKVGTRAMIS